MASRIRGRQAFEVGKVLGRTFPIWARNLVPFTILGLIVYAPLIAFAFLAYPREFDRDAILLYSLTLWFGGYLLGLIVTAALIYGVFRQLRGEPAPIGECLRVGFTRLLPVLAVGLLVFVLTMLGLIALIVGAIYVACMLWVAVPVAVVERPGVIASLKRSAQLTTGERGTIFLILLVLNILQRVVTFVAEKAVGPEAGTTYLVVILLVTLAFGMLGAVASAVGYHDLRVSKEGVETEDLVRVFA